ncbi:MAG: type I methionyl aminopeptidase [Bacteroidia bacterium]|nr:type I methionyl aminopeptidase [Bacteroidia bacterium]
MNIKIKQEQEIDLIRESSLLVGKTLGEVAKLIRPGVNTLMLDKVAEEFIRDHGGVPAFKNYPSGSEVPPFPFTLCISVNEEVVHGMPSAGKDLREGDIVSVDCGVLMNGYFGDSAYTFAVGEVSSKRKRLLRVTKESLYLGIEQARAGNFIGDVSQAIQFHAESHGYSIVREMVGHGIGQDLHEPPEVPNFGRKKTGIELKEGMVIAIEPMVNLGKRKIRVSNTDGWTVLASDGQPSAHFEHTVVIRKDKGEILSSFDYVESVEATEIIS